MPDEASNQNSSSDKAPFKTRVWNVFTFDLLTSTNSWAILPAFIIIAVLIFYGICRLSPDTPHIANAMALAPPLLLGSASILLTMNTRHTSIADRIRVLADSRYRLLTGQEVAPATRSAAISDQIKWFEIRYQLTRIAVGFMYLAPALLFFAFVVADLQKPAKAEGDIMLTAWAWTFFRCCLAAFLAGTVAAIIDVSVSGLTMSRALVATSQQAADEAKVSPDISSANAAMLTSFMTKYDAVTDEQGKNQGSSKKDATSNGEAINHRYWRLQFEQFRFFVNGLIPIPIYVDWMVQRNLEMQYGNDQLPGDAYLVSWKQFRKTCWSSDFVTFIESIALCRSRKAVADLVVDLRRKDITDDIVAREARSQEERLRHNV